MNAKQISKLVRCYDSGPNSSIDRYTVVFIKQPERSRRTYAALAMSAHPFQGFGQHCTAMLGRHLGKKIDFITLPEDCQKLVRQDLGA